MTSDPDAVADALATASQAFERGGTPEDGLANYLKTKHNCGKPAV